MCFIPEATSTAFPAHIAILVLGITALANVIPDMGAILSVNLLKNRIGSDKAQALVSILKEHPTLKSLCGNMGDETELDMSGKMNGAGDAVMLAAEVIDNVALLQLNIADNSINNAGRGMDHIGPAIAASTSITSLNIANNFIGINGGVVQVVQMLRNNGALAKFTFSGHFGSSKPVTMETAMAVADFSGKHLGVSGVWGHHALGLPAQVHVSTLICLYLMSPNIPTCT
jgi:hypothetical protein